MRIDRSSSSEEYVEPVLRFDATEQTPLVKKVRKPETFKLPSLDNKTRFLPSLWALEIEPLSPGLQKKINRICAKVVGSKDMTLREWHADNTYNDALFKQVMTHKKIKRILKNYPSHVASIEYYIENVINHLTVINKTSKSIHLILDSVGYKD